MTPTALNEKGRNEVVLDVKEITKYCERDCITGCLQLYILSEKGFNA
jgi:hypothetical protein